MEPTWQTADGRVKLYLGDCLDVLPTLEPGSVDAVVTDPPYGIGYQSGWDGELDRSIRGDETTLVRDAIIATDYPKAVFATWRCNPPIRPRGVLIWAKNAGGMGDLSFPWKPDFEVVWVYGNGWSGHRGSGILRASTVCSWNSGPAARCHPHEKPVDLLEQIIDKAPGEVICDPCCGSGTTGVAAVRLGRRFIGVELEPKYFEIAVKRIEAELNRHPMFDEKPKIIQRALAMEAV